ncbi:MAG TPA: Re/Si-specific NAD(P)(+) transhydrogenase subunit alpha [Candidatus Dormibacteraeota bacterium]|nr:Re/Si-specific NAD(P)(+) transhydrogenase subunit alpha [Candidatus Dormibacteraeota bacterium]
MIVAVPREAAPRERRVALVPESVARFVKLGTTVHVQKDAGTRASFPDELYERAGATIVEDATTLARDADLLTCVARPSDELLALLRKGTTIVGFFNPLGDPAYLQRLAGRGLTVLAVEAIPRITRAQSMDALSSQSNIAGYKGVLLAAAALPRFFPMLTTAAGTIPPAKVFVIGAGVAGLQAIATARRLGAVVSGYDARAVVKEQVQSLGATFVEFDVGNAEGSGGYARELTGEQLEAQQRAMAETIAKNDVVITTAAVPGRPAPVIVTERAVAAMQPGSVIVDLAAETGGNCALTKRDETIVTENGVTIVGTTNLAATMPYDASRLYSRNLFALLSPFVKDGSFALDPNDEIVKGACVVRDGVVGGSST